MAIDGINIIDSDSAHDVYISITDDWKEGKAFDEILQEALALQTSFCDDDEIPEVFTEIYWTALAYSLWKISHLPDDIYQKVATIIEQGASEQWAIVFDEKAVKLRQKALDKLLKKIQTPNTRPLKQRSPKILKPATTPPYFNIGDVVVIQYPDDFQQGYYGVFLVVDIEQSARKKEYHFAVTRYFEREVPSLTDVLMSDILFRGQLGFASSCWIAHKELKTLLPYFTKIANVELITHRMGVFSPANHLEDFYQYVDKNDPSYGGKTKQVVDVIKSIVEEF
ncbi:hypothetical protein [Moraxella sp. ZY210820]|uniref:hypothetical protein n=1 Tax=unclassified Moraxella TaxID=2685852 RepID=UPI00273181F9|nr:hypothetical protein [Moraxella sp. ZY210820]WLF84373.1 hypothetical protein LU301_02445 [Moraxella sp. ZY210820]